MPSGGRFPVLLTVAMFQTIREAFGLDWEIDWQGIDVADRASEVGGDITIRSGGAATLAVEGHRFDQSTVRVSKQRSPARYRGTI